MVPGTSAAKLASVLEDSVDEGEVELRVGEAAERLGVSPSTLRLWERRYGLPTPVRSAGGHRRYRLRDLDQLRALRDLVGRGHPMGRPAGDGTGLGDEEGAVLATTRSILRSRTPTEVRDAVVAFVRISGGDVVPAATARDGALPFDLSFGEGEPLLPTAEKPSVVRVRLERTLPAIHEDARRTVALLRAASDARSGGVTSG
jgi:hypothetical protein